MSVVLGHGLGSLADLLPSPGPPLTLAVVSGDGSCEGDSLQSPRSHKRVEVSSLNGWTAQPSLLWGDSSEVHPASPLRAPQGDEPRLSVAAGFTEGSLRRISSTFWFCPLRPRGILGPRESYRDESLLEISCHLHLSTQVKGSFRSVASPAPPHTPWAWWHSKFSHCHQQAPLSRKKKIPSFSPYLQRCLRYLNILKVSRRIGFFS